MSSTYKDLRSGLEEAIDHAAGRGSATIHVPEQLDVKAIREQTGLSQQRFSAAFGISVGTLRHWEQGIRTPRGPARVLLKVVSKNPAAVFKALHE